MKKNFFKKLFCAVSVAFTVCALGACQTTDKNAYIPVQSVDVTIGEHKDQSGQVVTKIASATMTFVNPSIYDTKEFEIHYKAYADAQRRFLLEEDTVYIPVRVRHGTSGTVLFSWETKPQFSAIEILPYDGGLQFKATDYFNVWETYLGWFIATIIIVAFGLLFFSFNLFRKGLTKQMVQETWRDHLGDWAFMACAILIICLFPLIFSSWVSTLILIGGLLAFLLLSFILTLIRAQFAK